MCGFFVEFRKKNTSFDINNFKKSAKLISHRGPDQNHSIHNEWISMEFFRLSIRDLSENGSQPMADYSKRYIIVFNGEIYNTSELKKKINPRILKGNSDTEILINLYAKYKSRMLNFIDGMFAFVIYDKIKKTCFIARDRFGIKPLYYQKLKNKIIISSEIKPLISYNKNNNFNNKALRDLFLKGYLDHDEKTFIRDVYSLKPGNFIKTDLKNYHYKRYWNIRNDIKLNQGKKSEIKNLLNNSIKKHLISDREIGLFLSGGTDSGIALHLINIFSKYKIKTFTYDFEGSGNFGESKLAKEISKSYDVENFKEIVKPSYVIENFDKMINKLESPFTSIRLFGTDKLYKASAKNDLKVIIEGHGGDEMLGGYGYNKFPYSLDNNFKKNIKINEIILKTFNDLEDKKFSIHDYQFVLKNQGLATTDGSCFYEKKIIKDNIFKNKNNFFSYNIDELSKYGFLKYSQIQDIESIKIPRVLKYSDRISMSYGIESRVPLLDKKLFQYCFNLNNNQKYLNGISRHLIKKIFEKEKISNFFTKNKKSIVDPQTKWLKTSLKEFLMDNINTTNLQKIEFLDPKQVRHYCSQFMKGKIQNSFLIFTILSTLRFIDNFKKY